MVRLSVEQRRQAAVLAALRVIASDGVEAATTRRIADEAQFGQSSLFYAFKSRDELLAAVVEFGVAQELAAMDGWLRQLADVTLDGPIDVSDMIRAAITAYVDDMIANHEREQALVSLALYARRTPGLAHLAERLYLGYYELVSQLLDEAARIAQSGWTIPTSELAPVVVAMTDGITLCYLGTSDRHRVESIVDSAVTLLSGYIGEP